MDLLLLLKVHLTKLVQRHTGTMGKSTGFRVIYIHVFNIQYRIQSSVSIPHIYKPTLPNWYSDTQGQWVSPLVLG